MFHQLKIVSKNPKKNLMFEKIKKLKKKKLKNFQKKLKIFFQSIGSLQ